MIFAKAIFKPKCDLNKIITNVDSGMTPEVKAASEALMKTIKAQGEEILSAFERAFQDTKPGAMEDMDTIRGRETRARLQKILDAQIKVAGIIALGERGARVGNIGEAEAVKGTAEQIVQDVRAGGGEIDVGQIDRAIKEWEAGKAAKA